MSAMPPNDNPFLNMARPTVPVAGSSATPAPAPAQVPAPGPRPVAHKHVEPSGLAGVKDTVEAIIIALILALTFRAFMVEAFVIPTGSMAPTLLGAHYRVICPKCGYEFAESADVNRQYHRESRRIMGEAEGMLTDNTALPAEDYRTCPNCGYHISARELPDQPPAGSFEREAIPPGLAPRNMFFPWANNGDRILVMKYQYAIAEPQRWDVIVFKEPQTGNVNYIKRLAGLPGETLEVIGGDLYAGAAAAGRPPVLHIQRKPDAVQRGMWQLVYDNDYYPIDAERRRTYATAGPGYTWSNPWKAAETDRDHWRIHSPEFIYDGTTASSVAFDVSGRGGNFYLYNICGYNPPDFNREPQNYDHYELRPRDTAPNPSWHKYVGDLHLETLWTPRGGSAPAISMTLGLPSNCFRAGVTPEGQVLLERLDPQTRQFVPVAPGTPGLTCAAAPALTVGQSFAVAMDNVDHSIHFWIDGKKLIDYEPDWTDAQGHRWVAQRGEGTVPPVVEIQIGGGGTLGHLKLMRDVYYTNGVPNARLPARGTDGNPITLLADEFFALGDNSNFSSDGRFWGMVDPRLLDLPGFRTEGNDHSGRVPRRYLLGRAFFVYWPAGFRPMDSIPVPIIPDAGHMRIIR